MSFRDLDRRSSAIAAGLQGLGMAQDIALPCWFGFNEDFITLVFALLKAGVSLGADRSGDGPEESGSMPGGSGVDGFVAIPMAHAVRWWLSDRFPKARFNVVVGGGSLAGSVLPTLAKLERTSVGGFQPVLRTDDGSGGGDLYNGFDWTAQGSAVHAWYL